MSTSSQSHKYSGDHAIPGAGLSPKVKIKACDTCRIRKVKCTFAPSSPAGESSTRSCILCKKHGFSCTFEREVRRKAGKESRTASGPRGTGGKVRPIAPIPRRPKERSSDDVSVSKSNARVDGEVQGVVRRDGSDLVHENPQSNPFDQILPRTLLLSAISTFFDHLYCLTPLVHKPTFLSDLEKHREEQPDSEEWVSLVLMLVAATLVQAPWAFTELGREDIVVLARAFYKKGKTWLVDDFNEITVGRFLIESLGRACMVSAHLEENGMAEMFRGSLWGLIFKLRMHEESSYEGLDPIEAELRRRVFWLAFGLDKARCAVHADMVHITGEHCADVQLPKALDDEYISREGYLTPPMEETPILLGFCYVSRIFEILGQALDLRRIDRRRNPTGIHLQMRLNEVNGLLELCESIMDDCPPALRLSQPGHRLGSIHSKVQNAFLVQQANIYMTQQMTRQLLLEYRAQLRALQRHHQLGDLGQVGMPLTDMHLQSGLSDEEKECVSRDVLNVLEAIPMQALAVNTTGVVNKVRFVAVSLLDGLSETGPGDNEGNEVPSRSQYHRDYLWKFLTTLGEIEAMSSLKDPA
ncbi:hypothetical protein I302_102489 [Kwoniella bestiolae CBS 10118]|uniref:Zn(2)-C6 fungal-type domain-containing protein n=1 Tax=Kwoniella bestiolae CBS 10118 TaxID=1296100 RepID=A0A1B9GF96_9TREE|nr:hypothetical protein I302_01179 [Kwoniella bestiolae CBS 10118]OCF29668.1 hypothetical protein I302_01179 [Kwoniella bestiolae CBS 10118]